MAFLQKCTSKNRRDVINDTLLQMRDTLPLTYDVSQRISQLQTMSLACVRLRKARYFAKLLSHSYESLNNFLSCPMSTSSVCKALAGFILVMTADGKLIHISDNVVDYLGHGAVDLLSQGDSLYDVIDRRDNRNVKMRLHQQQEKGVTCSFLCRMSVSRNLRRRTGLGESRVIHVQGRFTAPPGSGADAKDKNIFVGMCLPLPSINQNKHISLLPDDTTLTCHMTLSHDLTFIDTAPNVSTVLGYEPDWLLGQTLYQVVHPSDATTLASKHQQLSQNPGAKSVVIRLVTSTGNVIWANVTLLLKQTGVVTCTVYVIDEMSVEAFRTHNLYSTVMVAKEPEYLNSATASASNASMEITIVKMELSASCLPFPAKSISCDYPSTSGSARDWQQQQQVLKDCRSKSNPCLLPSAGANLTSPSQQEMDAYAYDSLSSTLSSAAASPSTYICNDALMIDVDMSPPSSCYSSPYSNNVTNIINVANNLVYGGENTFPASPADSCIFLQHQQQLASGESSRRGSHDSYITNSSCIAQPSYQSANVYGQMQDVLPFTTSIYQQLPVSSSSCASISQDQWATRCQPPLVTGSFLCIDSNQASLGGAMNQMQATDAWRLMRGGLQDAGMFPSAAQASASSIPLSLPATCSSVSSASQQQQSCFSANPLLQHPTMYSQDTQAFNCLQAAVYAQPTLTLAQQQTSLFASSNLVSSQSLCQSPSLGANVKAELGGNLGYSSGRMDTPAVSRPLPISWVCW